METLSATDKGKAVVNGSGEKIGHVVGVDNGRARIEPDPDISDTVMSKLGWNGRDDETYLLEAGTVDTITNDQIRTHTR